MKVRINEKLSAHQIKRLKQLLGRGWKGRYSLTEVIHFIMNSDDGEDLEKRLDLYFGKVQSKSTYYQEIKKVLFT